VVGITQDDAAARLRESEANGREAITGGLRVPAPHLDELDVREIEGVTAQGARGRTTGCGRGRRWKKRKKWWGPHLEGGMEGLQKGRVGGGIWRGLKNGGPFGGPARVVFFHQTSKIWSRGPYGGPPLELLLAMTSCWS
jgi:hypothetical protein